MYVVNQFEINESMHSKKIFVHIFNYTCILLLCSCTGKKELSFKLLRRFWNWWFLLLLKAHEISSFVLSAIHFISHLDSNKYTIKKQEEVTKGYFGRVWASSGTLQMIVLLQMKVYWPWMVRSLSQPWRSFISLQSPKPGW